MYHLRAFPWWPAGLSSVSPRVAAFLPILRGLRSETYRALLINHRPISREEAAFFSLSHSAIAIVVADAAYNVNNFNRSARTRRLASRLSASEYEALIILSSRNEPARQQRARRIILWPCGENAPSDNRKDRSFNIDAIASFGNVPARGIAIDEAGKESSHSFYCRFYWRDLPPMIFSTIVTANRIYRS